jgi:hypothetical protein
MNGLDFSYFHFRVERIRSGKCITHGGRCLVCELAWEGWPQLHCKHAHGSGMMDTNGNGEFTCHDCGDVQTVGRGLSVQPT